MILLPEIFHPTLGRQQFKMGKSITVFATVQQFQVLNFSSESFRRKTELSES
jgi:hypothetical protein